MVLWNEQQSDVVLLAPQESLLLQVAQWGRRHRRFPIRLVSAVEPAAIIEAAGEAAFVCIDAGAQPERALGLLDTIRDHVDLSRLVVYSDAAMPDWEVQFRSRGATFLLGPLSPGEWEDVFVRLAHAEAVGS